MICRRISTQDVQQVIALGKLMHISSKYAHIPFDEASVDSLIRTAIDAKHVHAWVVEDDVSIIGVLCIASMSYYFATPRIACDLALFVNPDNRSIRVTNMLVKSVEDWCKDNNMHALVMSVTASIDHRRVGKLYEHLGYQEWGSIYRKEFS